MRLQSLPLSLQPSLTFKHPATRRSTTTRPRRSARRTTSTRKVCLPHASPLKHRELTGSPYPDIEHFLSHEEIEEEEDERVRQFTGEEPDFTPEQAAAATPEEVQQHIFNELNGIADEATTAEEKAFVDKATAEEDAGKPHAEVVKPLGHKEMPPPTFNPAGKQGQEGGAQKTFRNPPPVDDGSPETAPTPQERARRERAQFARQQAAKFSKDVREAMKRGEWGSGQSGEKKGSFARPKDAADRLRRNVPYKYKVRVPRLSSSLSPSHK